MLFESKLLKRLFLGIYSRLYPKKYLKYIGLNFDYSGLYLYGNVSWGSEPWIITLGKNVHITDGCKFVTHDGGTLIFRQYIPDLEITKPIIIGNDVYLGTNVIILPGVTIGNNVVVGAGAVVSRDIKSNSLAVGVPARVIKTSHEYLEKLEKESIHLGHLKGKEKDKALKEYYCYKDSKKDS